MEVSERYISFGKSLFYKEVAIPTGEEIVQLSRKYPCSEEADDVDIKFRPTAFLTGLEALIGVVVFLGTWSVKKVLDDVYEEAFRPAIREKIRKYIGSNEAEKKYSLSVALNKRNSPTSVLICCTGASLEEIENSELYLGKIVALIEGHFLEKQTERRVLLFNIDNGKFDLEPKTFRTHTEALEGLKGLYRAKPLKYIKNENS